VASLDKTSVKDEVGRLKADFDRLGSEGKVSSEVQAIMNSLFMIIELILAIFLERSTKKDNKNSSKPSSQTEKDESALSHSGSNGKGKSENKDQAGNTRVKETVTIAQVLACDVCAQDLSDVPCIDHERRTKIDIVFEKVVDHIDAEIKCCPVCCATVKGLFPSDRHGPLQYGDGLKAFVINLLVGQVVALNRVQKLVKSMIGVVIAEASLLKFVLRLYQVLATWEHQATAWMFNAPTINVDETSFRVDTKNHWIHVYSSGDVTLKFLHRNRGKAAIDEINIIPRYGGAIIHDCWSSYLSYHGCGHGLCGSHLLRELAFIVDTHGYAWARNMKRLLQETCKEAPQAAAWPQIRE
jgi:transposase